MRRIHRRQVAAKILGIDLESKPMHELEDALKASDQVEQFEATISSIRTRDDPLTLESFLGDTAVIKVSRGAPRKGSKSKAPKAPSKAERPAEETSAQPTDLDLEAATKAAAQAAA